MSIFGSILSKILGRRNTEAAAAPSDDAASSTAPATTTTATGAVPPSAVPTAAPVLPAVDVEAVLAGMAAKNSQTLDWRRSIVDLMKLLDLDSGLEARKSLARELGYSGSTEDTATMNIWLHRQVMAKLAENGGKVPDSLRS